MSTAINHDYPSAGALQVVNEEGEPVEAAQVRLFDQVDYDAGNVDTWVGETTTDINGEWLDPIIVDDGRTWVVHFEKPTMYGPVHREVTT